jgi:sulfur-oxidizing protein SoxZ
MASIKLKAKAKKDIVSVKCLINHPMETGLRKVKETGKLVPAHYITEVTCTKGDATLLSSNWSGGVSANPYLEFHYAGAKGDEITLSWKDNKGGSDTKTAKVR